MTGLKMATAMVRHHSAGQVPVMKVKVILFRVKTMTLTLGSTVLKVHVMVWP